jgi:hypothetical protein
MSCTTPYVVNIPGPRGAAGANGTNGTNGVDSFTYTTALFLVPALGANVVVQVDNSSFLPESIQGQFFVSVQGCGYMQVLDVVGLSITLRNPAAGVLGVANAIPTTPIPSGSLITLAGAVGPQGAPGVAGGASSNGTYIVRTPDVSIPSATALDSLSAGYLKTQGSGGFGAVSTVATIPVGDISGVLPVAKGGTNLSSTPTNGQLLIGNGSGFTLASLTAGSNVTITPSAGGITIDSTASGSSFNYVTFTRRVTGTGGTAPLLGIGTTTNPFNATTYPSATYGGIDTSSGFNASNGRYVVPVSGYYMFSSMLNLLGSSGKSTCTIALRKNGSPILTTLAFGVDTGGYHPNSIEYIDQATAGDFYEIYVTSASHSTLVETGSSFSTKRIQA